jgi:hypothetical protein
MKRYNVKEGNTGVLELMDDAGNVEIYRPDCDLDKAQALLYQFYNISTSNGMNVKDAFIWEDTDWFPTAISMLYWKYFYQVVKYRPLLEKYLLGQIEFKNISPGKFYNLIQIILEAQGKDKDIFKKIIRKMYGSIIQVRNMFVPNKQGDLLFFRYGLDDFRTKELLEQLENKYRVLQVTGVSYKNIISNFFNRSIYILPLTQLSKTHILHLNHDDKDLVFKYALSFAETVINNHRYNYDVNLANFRNFEYKLFFGLDDANIVYPLIYAAQDVGIKALGFQHGVYARRHEAYVMQGIEKYRWYDNVLVWGEYWKSNLLKNSNLYSSTYHIVSSNKHYYDYKYLPKKGKNKVILIPYEFLSDSIKVGEYVKKFIKAGFKVLFKPRTDELLQDQLNSYFLDEFKDKIEIINDITPKKMAEIDVIAGTQTTLLFDLLPYNKPIWILETSFRLMYDMVEDGFARLITESDMQRINKIFEEEKSKEKMINSEYLTGKIPVIDAIADYLDVGVSKK